jgi:hypothetical protein
MCCTLYASHFTTHEKAGNNDGENKLLLNKIYESWEKLLVVEREGGRRRMWFFFTIIIDHN